MGRRSEAEQKLGKVDRLKAVRLLVSESISIISTISIQIVSALIV